MITDRLSTIAATMLVLLLISITFHGVLEAAQIQDRGRELYMTHCSNCHGENGDGQGSAFEYLPRKPRSFIWGIYKIKTSMPDSLTVLDSDLFNVIARGMSASGMPPWKDVLSKVEIEELVAYIKTFSDMPVEEEPVTLDFSGRIAYSEQSVERGRVAYMKMGCHECHGKEGVGDGIQTLKDDYGDRIWPRDLNKPWIYVGPSDPTSIYARITNGIPLTPMPAYSTNGPEGNMESVRWDIANYIHKKGLDGIRKRKIHIAIIASIAGLIACIVLYLIIGRETGRAC